MNHNQPEPASLAERRLVVASLTVLSGISTTNLRAIRRGAERSHTAYVRAADVRELLELLDELRPGIVDDYLERVGAIERHVRHVREGYFDEACARCVDYADAAARRGGE